MSINNKQKINKETVDTIRNIIAMSDGFIAIGKRHRIFTQISHTSFIEKKLSLRYLLKNTYWFKNNNNLFTYITIIQMRNILDIIVLIKPIATVIMNKKFISQQCHRNFIHHSSLVIQFLENKIL